MEVDDPQELFVKTWGLSYQALHRLRMVSPNVAAAAMDNFAPPPDTRDMNGRFLAFLKMTAKREESMHKQEAPTCSGCADSRRRGGPWYCKSCWQCWNQTCAQQMKQSEEEARKAADEEARRVASNLRQEVLDRGKILEESHARMEPNPSKQEPSFKSANEDKICDENLLSDRAHMISDRQEAVAKSDPVCSRTAAHDAPSAGSAQEEKKKKEKDKKEKKDKKDKKEKKEKREKKDKKDKKEKKENKEKKEDSDEDEDESDQNEKWDAICGLEKTKRSLQEMLLYPIQHPEKFEKFGITPSRGVLLYGPPGCGKTLLAKAIATKRSAKVVSIKGPELISICKFRGLNFGETEANIRGVFAKARAEAPCVLFCDELDSIGAARGSCGRNAGDRVMNQLLTEIDGVGVTKNMFFLGATNRPELLDEALLQPGRLDQLIYVPLPDQSSRLSILQSILRKSPVAPDLSLPVLAERTEGFSGADLVRLYQRATTAAILEEIAAEGGSGSEGVSMDIDTASKICKKHFEEALGAPRPSLNAMQLAKYDQFRNKFDPLSKVASACKLGQNQDTPVHGHPEDTPGHSLDDKSNMKDGTKTRIEFIEIPEYSNFNQVIQEAGQNFWVGSVPEIQVEKLPHYLVTYQLQKQRGGLLAQDIFSHCYYKASVDAAQESRNICKAFGNGLKQKHPTRGSDGQRGCVFVFVKKDGPPLLLQRPSVEKRIVLMKIELTDLEGMMKEAERNTPNFWFTAVGASGVEDCQKKMEKYLIDGKYARNFFMRCVIAEASEGSNDVQKFLVKCGLGLRRQKVRSDQKNDWLGLFLDPILIFRPEAQAKAEPVTPPQSSSSVTAGSSEKKRRTSASIASSSLDGA